MLVHIFEAKSSPCCANKALNLTAQDNEESYSPEVIKAVRRNFYVDDVFKSVPTNEQGIPIRPNQVIEGRWLLSHKSLRVTVVKCYNQFHPS